MYGVRRQQTGLDRARQDRTGQGKAGQARAGQGRAGQGKARQGRAAQEVDLKKHLTSALILAEERLAVRSKVQLALSIQWLHLTTLDNGTGG